MNKTEQGMSDDEELAAASANARDARCLALDALDTIRMLIDGSAEVVNIPHSAPLMSARSGEALCKALTTVREQVNKLHGMTLLVSDTSKLVKIAPGESIFNV